MGTDLQERGAAHGRWVKGMWRPGQGALDWARTKVPRRVCWEREGGQAVHKLSNTVARTRSPVAASGSVTPPRPQAPEGRAERASCSRSATKEPWSAMGR